MTAASLLQQLTEFGDDVVAEYDTIADLPPDATAILMVAVRDLRADLATFYRHLEQDLIHTVGVRHMVVEGVGEVSVHHKTKRTGWRHAEMIPAIIARVMDEPATIYDPETGELLPHATIGANVAARLRECVSMGAGKVTGLRAIGLQPDEFCNEEDDGWSVQLPPRQL